MHILAIRRLRAALLAAFLIYFAKVSLLSGVEMIVGIHFRVRMTIDLGFLKCQLQPVAVHTRAHALHDQV